ncbi:MAG: rhodanese-like domain-containing protein [Thermoproteota archaeon]|nr:rhodanese-like domain-containing protein [Thermoproteota archaeon]
MSSSSSSDPEPVKEYHGLAISAEELVSKLSQREDPIMIFDIGNEDRYKREHIPGSRFMICDDETINTTLPKMPNGIDIVLIGEDENYTKEMAQMARDKVDLQTRYLQGGLAAWKWDKTSELDPRITPNDLKQALDQGKLNREVFLVDVREPEEFNDWSIEGSENIPLSQVPYSLDRIPKDKKVVTICPAGNRSGMVTLMLQRLGYNSKTLEDGLIAWSSAYERVARIFELAEDKRARIVQLRRIGKGCLSYIVESDCEAAIIDPLLPIDDYIKIAEGEMNAKITKVMDTHLHADHVSGARELADKTKAELYLSPYEDYKDIVDGMFSRLNDNDVIRIGSIPLRVIHTPGHTQGSVCLWFGNKILFTGDTLFVNNVGRPDLKDQAVELAAKLHASIKGTIFRLPEDTIILPAHHNKPIESDTFIEATLKNIKGQQNLQEIFGLQKEPFVERMISITMPTPPSYKDIMPINKGEKNKPSSLKGIHQLEMGPNRCSA